jgi:RimJ/RimL family protein N-acetyltransferase
MIGSSRIILTVLHNSEVSREYLETLNDSEYLKFSQNANFIHTLSSQIQYITNFKLSNNLLYGIKNTEDGKLLGTITCYINFTLMTLDLGFLVFKNQQGKGYASEALGLLIPYLQAQFPGMCAVIGSDRNNFAMHQVAKKLNFQIEGEDFPEDNLSLRFVRSFPQVNSQHQPMVPDYIFNANRIGVAAFDAGGAEQISWILRNLPQKVLCYIDGPAQKIFNNSGILFDQVDQLNQIMECDLIITGSGWMSDLEITAIKEAKLRDIPCVTVLDHWVNYLERFGQDEECQPQILAVTNLVALQIAQEKFPNKVVWLLPDFQLESYQKEIKRDGRSPTGILILLEPTSASNSIFAINYDLIAKLIESAFSIKQARGLNKVLIRPHPSQVGDSRLLSSLKEIPGEFEMSKSASLIEDLEGSKVVLGFSSYALYISAMCGIDTYSYFAGMKGHWTERFSKISLLPTNV